MSSAIMDAEPVTPRSSPGVRALVGAVFVVGGLGLIVCGGAFLIGAMCLVQPQLVQVNLTPAPLSPEASGLLTVLYCLAAACLLGAVTLFIFAVRGLLSIFADK